MGAVRVEMYKKGRGSSGYPGSIKELLKVATETSSTTATTAGSRIQAPTTNGALFASIVVDEDCFVAIGVDPTAAVAPANSWLLKANVARELPVAAGDKFSFKDVA